MESVPVGFARVLRRLGVRVPVASVIAYADALGATGLDHRSHVYWAGRATLVRSPDDIAAYDAAFAAFWLGAPPEQVPPPPTTTTAATDDDNEHGRRASPHEILKAKDFAAYSDAEFAEARRLMSAFTLTPPRTKRTRRTTPTNRRQGALDLRRTVRHSLATHGEAIRLAHKRRITKPRRLVFLLDVSGSMEPYARALVRFVHAAVAARPHGTVDAFALGTRVTRITRDLAQKGPDAAVARVLDWAGGTRLGDGIRHINDAHAARSAHVVILSDGWERGDPAHLAAHLTRLQRTTHRITWVNPHKATPGYTPLARGMAAALPYVDDFVEGHSLDALEALAHRINASA